MKQYLVCGHRKRVFPCFWIAQLHDLGNIYRCQCRIEMKVELISTSCLRVFKASKLLGIPEPKFDLEPGVINIDYINWSEFLLDVVGINTT